MRSLPDGIGREQLQATQMNDSTIFLSGGLSVISGSLIYQNTCYTYNTKKDTCIFAGELPNGAINHSASLLPNGEVLITGGFDGSAAHNHVTVFNLLSGLRTISTNLSTGVSSHTAVRAGGKVYIYGGFNIPAFTYSNELHVYDSETDSLYLLANGPYGCSQQAMVSFGNSILIAGGNKLLDNGSVGVTSEAYLFNIQTNEFTPLSPMPSQRSEMSLAPIGNSGKFLFSGGHISASEPYNTGIIYDANLTLKANGPEQKEALKIHSDPAGNQIFIKAGFELLHKKYTIFDVRGKTLREGMLNETQTRISTLEFTPGMYLISIEGIKSARFMVYR
jgi:N-acetylneuraminic acid mutarotase